MAGTVLERELTRPRATGVSYSVATRADDPEIRRLLRENPMPGRITLSMEREPDFFAEADTPGETKQTIVAREAGRLLCVGSCAVRERFVNGEPRRVGYLGGLRLDARVAGRAAVVRQGYEFFHSLQTDAPADFYFTSIAADNERALRLLERNVPGMPAYEFLDEFVTLLVPVPRRQKNRHGDTASQRHAPTPTADEFSAFLQTHGKRHQFAPCWSSQQLVGMQPARTFPDNFQLTRDDGHLSGCAALWDQRAFKQLVIRGYSPWLNRARPCLNATAKVFGHPRLPDVGTVLAHAFVSHLAITDNEPETLRRLMAGLQHVAAARQVEFLTLGFAAIDPKLALLRRMYRAREYRSRLYLVRWPDIGGSAVELDKRLLAPEVALL